MDDFPWKEGEVYLTKSGLHARIISVKVKAIPKDWKKEFIESLNIASSHFGIEGYVYPKSNPKGRVAGSWTMTGKHSSSDNDFGDLTTEKV